MSGSPPPIPSVETERLLLRAIQPEDLDKYHSRLFADPEVMRFLPGGRPIPRERLDGLVERSHHHWRRYGYGVWVVLDRAPGEIIGQCGLRFVEEAEETEVLYALARNYWGRGLATEGARAALEFGFDNAGLERIVGFADRGNVASCKVMEHLGMENHGPIRIFEMDALRYSIDLDRFREHERQTSSLG